MKLFILIVAALALMSSDLAFSQSVEIVTPKDGRIVNIDGFMVQVEVDGLQEMLDLAGFNDLHFQLGVMHSGGLEGEIYFGMVCQASASYNAYFWGRNIKLVHPDFYFKSHCAYEENSLQITFRAENFAEQMFVDPGDSLDLHFRATIFPADLIADDWVTVTVR